MSASFLGEGTGGVLQATSFEAQLVAGGLSFPTSVTFDHGGIPIVAECGLPFGGAPPGGRVMRIAPDSTPTVLAERLRPPVNGLTFHDGGLYVSEAGHPARILRLEPDGRQRVILEGLPGPGNYHTNMVAFGPDGKLYFSQGAMTNSAIVGLDAYEVGWLRHLPHAHDLPGYRIELAGVNVITADPLADDPTASTETGAFAPFGTHTEPGQRIEPSVPCTAGIMRCEEDGSDLQVFAWGLRNPFGIGFLPDGRLLAVDQGADDRGSRPIGDAPDVLFHVRAGAWYGWPDFIDGEPVTTSQYRPTRGPHPTFVLRNHDELPPPERSLLRFPPHTAAVKFDIAPRGWGPYAGQIMIALFGDERPMTAPPGPRAGRGVGRIDPTDWTLHPFQSGPWNRPIDIRFCPTDGSMYVLDFGKFEMSERGLTAEAETGALWRFRQPPIQVGSRLSQPRSEVGKAHQTKESVKRQKPKRNVRSKTLGDGPSPHS